RWGKKSDGKTTARREGRAGSDGPTKITIPANTSNHPPFPRMREWRVLSLFFTVSAVVNAFPLEDRKQKHRSVVFSRFTFHGS
ncbi:MAG: hypothetical protein LBI87_10610, partial [Candidatus Accumulibacter sp.]|nr:hypothetical protein [Accumulibacter sp.]